MIQASTTLRRVRVQGADLDAMTARLRLQSMLAGAELRPPGLAPAALLFVRRVSAQPRTALPLEAGALRPPPEWEAALVSELERALREAARPALGLVPATAAAVLFADRAELLACLARDALDGTVASRWWWASALAAAGARNPAHAAWLGEPRHVPAALELLATWNVAAAFARTLPAAVVTELAAGVARVFGIPDGEGVPAPTKARGARPEAQAPSRTAAEPARAPWSHVVPEADEPALEVEQRQMLALALTLRRAPTLARTEIFARAARAWRPMIARPPRRLTARPGPGRSPQFAAVSPQETGVDDGPHVPRAAEPTSPPVASPERPSQEMGAPAPSPAAPKPRPHEGEPTLRRKHASATAPVDAGTATPPVRAATASDQAPAEPPTRERTPSERALTSSEPREAGGSARAPAPASERDAPARAPSARAQQAPASRPLPAPTAPETAPDPRVQPVETELGGLFYLLNLALYLDLYGDFTRPREPGIALSPWDLVELLGVALLGGRPPDPMWELLAGLAGREPGEPPGRGFRPPRAWRVPRAWLEPFEPEGAWRWSAAGGTLRVMHPAAFLAVAVARSAAPVAEQLRRELARLGASRAPLARSALPREPARPLVRWAARLAAYAQARLRLALALEPSDSVARTLLEHRARVHVTPSQVDVELTLASLPLEVRFAGLDRTPGFIPATGRVVALHFR